MILFIMGLIGLLLISIPSTVLLLIYVVFYLYGTRYRLPRIQDTMYNGIVSIIIPVRNEPIELMQEALNDIYSWNIRDNIEVIIISDDPPERLADIEKLVYSWRQRGLNVHLIWRSEPKGYKAGALNTALLASRGKYLYVVDVDSRVSPSFIVKAANIMMKNKNVAAVVARWTGKNRDTRVAEAVFASMKFIVDALYKGRSALNLPVFPVGTGTLFNAEFIRRELGGWDEERIQDDMEIGCRIMARGKEILFLDDEKVYVEVPRRFKSLRVQQERWAYGSADTAIARFKDILKAPLPWYAKLEAFNFLLQYLPAFLIFLGFLIVAPISYFLNYDFFKELWILGVPWLVSAVLYIRYYARSLGECGYSVWRSIVNLGRSSAITALLTPTISYALIKAFLRIKMSFKRTPKGIHEHITNSYRVPVEIIIGVLILLTGIILVIYGIVYTGLWCLFYSAGYLYGIYRWGKDLLFK
ncbi:glycosyltransferase [Staphylothermus hellenicus]|uniref:Glycosyl transferase family 2 n=1 Tax=Staphylothermus hellenicus (strain DSM 12710 / JCM 10830 / BK20S6-10-b1 / P8) TaxID=591019 RepID=D7D8V7_STAHD|nr:glycosyltransferase family 2 protein [Staphylothermus hellenicus]ADI32203.1 glycosyl transferase family 2 [Staphylothermus hellenicus DSM 12710]